MTDRQIRLQLMHLQNVVALRAFFYGNKGVNEGFEGTNVVRWRNSRTWQIIPQLTWSSVSLAWSCFLYRLLVALCSRSRRSSSPGGGECPPPPEPPPPPPRVPPPAVRRVARIRPLSPVPPFLLRRSSTSWEESKVNLSIYKKRFLGERFT